MTFPPIQKVVVLGAGGTLGASVIGALTTHFDVTVVTRKSSSAPIPSHVRAERIGDDYPAADLLRVLRGQEAVVSLISPWACQIQKEIIDVAVEAGIRLFIPAEFGYDTTNKNALEILPALQVRVDIVEHLKDQESKGMAWTALVTSTFLDWGLSNGFLGFDLKKHEAVIYDDGNQYFSASTVALVGDAVAKSILRPEATRNRYVYVSSVTTTQNKILALLEKYSGAKWKTSNVNSAEKIREARVAFEREEADLVEASRLLILAILYTPGNGSDFSGRDSNEALGLMKEDISVIIERLTRTASKGE